MGVLRKRWPVSEDAGEIGNDNCDATLCVYSHGDRGPDRMQWHKFRASRVSRPNSETFIFLRSAPCRRRSENQSCDSCFRDSNLTHGTAAWAEYGRLPGKSAADRK